MYKPTIKKHLRRGLVVIAGLLALLLLALSVVYLLSDARLHRTYEVGATLQAPRASLQDQGRQLAHSRGCADCHGDDFGGKVMLDEMPFARIVAGNLTPAPGAIDRRLRHEQLYRALHHGVGPDLQPLLLMPSGSFSKLSMLEVEALSAYFDTLKPVERALPETEMGPLGRALLLAGKLDGFMSAETIDHGKPAVPAPPPAGSLDYGRHTAQLCMGCHGADFAGGRMPHGGPKAPLSANLTPHATGLAAWDEVDFVTAMRTGKRPDGSTIDEQYMPWRAFGQGTDEELRAVWRYLRTVPPVENLDPEAPVRKAVPPDMHLP